MTIAELEATCANAESQYAFKVNAGFVVKVPKEAKGKRMRIAPGLTGSVVGQQGDLTLVWLDCPDVRRFIAKAKEGATSGRT